MGTLVGGQGARGKGKDRGKGTRSKGKGKRGKGKGKGKWMGDDSEGWWGRATGKGGSEQRVGTMGILSYLLSRHRKDSA
jgi:hypothetical protein